VKRKNRKILSLLVAMIIALGTLLPAGAGLFALTTQAAPSMVVVSPENTSFMPGETFTLSVELNENTGFASGAITLNIPQGFEVIAIEVGHPDLINGIVGPPGWNSFQGTLSAPVRDRITVGWGRAANYTIENENLLSYTIRILPDAPEGLTTFTMSFTNAAGDPDPFSCLNGTPLGIVLPAFGEVNVVYPSEMLITAWGLPEGAIAPGHEFQLSLYMNGNTGFAGGTIRLSLPNGLEVTRVETSEMLEEGFTVGPEIFPTTGNIFAAWGGRTENIYKPNLQLVTFYVRVQSHAESGATGNITVSMHNAAGVPDPFRDYDENELNIVLENGGDIGNVHISRPGDNLPNTVIIASALPTEVLKFDDTFELTLSISENPGFTNGAMRIAIPTGLEIIEVQLHNPLLRNGLYVSSLANEIPVGEAGEINLSQTLTDEIIFAWGHETGFSVADTPLITLTLRVDGTTQSGETDPIRLTFESRPGGALAPDVFMLNEIPLNMSTVPPGGNIGTVEIYIEDWVPVLLSLRGLIEYAQARYDETVPSEHGNDVPPTQYWATTDVLADFYAAIATAQEIYDMHRQ